MKHCQNHQKPLDSKKYNHSKDGMNPNDPVDAPHVERSAAYLAHGALALVEFLGPNQQPVDRFLAQQRADICFKCPKNKSAKGWVETISKAAAKATKSYFKLARKMNLTVDGEERLGICQGCSCPLKLKVHIPIQHIADFTYDEVLADLDRDCWIPDEMQSQNVHQ